jgi:hypothetical protein
MSEVEHVGFTGTRLGLSSKQRHALRTVLAELHNDGAIWFHHGDCIGADEEAHEVAMSLRYKVHVHPPSDFSHRAFCNMMNTSDQPAPYMVRNQAIVDACAILITSPQQWPLNPRPMRSGTWSTVRKAEKKGIPRVIIYADGTVERE